MMDIYRENILDHYRNPRNFGKLENPDICAEAHNPFCGDSIWIGLILQQTKIKQAKFFGEGCAISLASASMLTQKIQGETIADLHKIGKSDILTLLGIKLMPTRLKCALLPLEVLQQAIAKYDKRQNNS